ncbi:hypothetical protein Btru_060544 [Bulinus truncatus]|nr:hypothetical protein Btru_060544 [Bulinus truncatus]
MQEREILRLISGPYEVTVSGPYEVTVSGPYEVTVSGPYEVTVSGPFEVTVSGPYEVTVSGPYEVTVSGPYEVTVSGAYEVTVSGAYEVMIRGDIIPQGYHHTYGIPSYTWYTIIPQGYHHTSASPRDLHDGDKVNGLKSLLFQQVYNEMTENDQDLVKDLAKINHLLETAKFLDQPSSKQLSQNDINDLFESPLLDPTSDKKYLDSLNKSFVKFNTSPSSSSELDSVYTRIKELMNTLNEVVGALQDLKISKENLRQPIDTSDFMSDKINECIANLKALNQIEPLQESINVFKRRKDFTVDYNKCHNDMKTSLDMLGLPSLLKDLLNRFVHVTTLAGDNKLAFMIQTTQSALTFSRNLEQNPCLRHVNSKLKPVLENFQKCANVVSEKLKKLLESCETGSGSSNKNCPKVKSSNNLYKDETNALLQDIQRCTT